MAFEGKNVARLAFVNTLDTGALSRAVPFATHTQSNQTFNYWQIEYSGIQRLRDPVQIAIQK